MQKTSTVTLWVPEVFAMICKEGGINEVKALQLYINHLLIMAVITEKRAGDPASQAADLFAAPPDSHIGKAPSIYRLLHAENIRSLLALLKEELDPETKQWRYNVRIDKWYADLNLNQ
jgi:hypothetical protein